LERRLRSLLNDLRAQSLFPVQQRTIHLPPSVDQSQASKKSAMELSKSLRNSARQDPPLRVEESKMADDLPQFTGQDRFDALQNAMKWSQLPPEHLAAALKALEPYLAREHEYRMEQAKLAAEAEVSRQAHALHRMGMISGLLISVAMLGCSVLTGLKGDLILSIVLAGPSVLALAALFIFRKSDTAYLQVLSRAQESSSRVPITPSVDEVR
jgi:hypothetical protein